MPKLVPVIGPDLSVLQEIARADARQMVLDKQAKWWNGCRAVRLLDFEERWQFEPRGQSARPGPRTIENYAEIASSLLPGAVTEVIAAADCWAGRVTK